MLKSLNFSIQSTMGSQWPGFSSKVTARFVFQKDLSGPVGKGLEGPRYRQDTAEGPILRQSCLHFLFLSNKEMSWVLIQPVWTSVGTFFPQIIITETQLGDLPQLYGNKSLNSLGLTPDFHTNQCLKSQEYFPIISLACCNCPKGVILVFSCSYK